jgi:hypothetical protein
MTDAPRTPGTEPEESPVASRIQAITALLAARTGRGEERAILDILEFASASELEPILAAIDVKALVRSMDDRLRGPDNLTALLKLLTEDRLTEVSVPRRAALVRALQEGRTGAMDERAIRAIFLGTRGAALTELKAALDTGGHYRDVHQLLFRDIDDPRVLFDILEHIEREGLASPSGEVKVLSDIDDTFYANWKDKRYPGKTVYPGVLELYAELDRGPGEAPGRIGDITFVTARPGDRAGLVEGATHKALRERGVGASTVLCGSLTCIIGNQAIAGKKLENFRQYRMVYPEYGFVFIGDSGQGDVYFGENIRSLARDAVKGVFIHDVVSTSEGAREDFRKRGVFFFDTYVGAAWEAYRLGLIQREGLARVAAAAVAQMRAIAFETPAQRDARMAELVSDIDKVRDELLPEERPTLP